MTRRHFPAIGAACFLIAISSSGRLSAQEPPGPQTAASPPVLPKPAPAPAGSGEKVIVPAGTRIGVPVGSYLRGELLESKRPGRVKGRGEFRMRLNTLILPTGYTVDLNAAP